MKKQQKTTTTKQCRTAERVWSVDPVTNTSLLKKQQQQQKIEKKTGRKTGSLLQATRERSPLRFPSNSQ